MKNFILSILALLMLTSISFATTYYADPAGGGASSCVDSGANVCTLPRAVAVSGTGTNTIIAAAGTYDVGSNLNFNSGMTGCNMTIQSASGLNDVFLASTGGTAVIQISATTKSGQLTLNHISLSDTDATRLILNSAPEFSITVNSGAWSNTEATKGYGIEYAEDTTNKISQVTATAVYTGLKTGATTNTKVAQQITVGGSNITTNRVALKLKRYGTSSPVTSGWDYRNAETLTVTVETNSAGAPSGTPVTNGTSTTKLAFDVNPNSEWVYFDFASNMTLTASTVYWIVLTPSYTASSTNYIGWEVNTSGAYAGGDSATYNGTSWTGSAASTDYSFVINRRHDRDLTVSNMSLTHIKEAFITKWARNVVFDSVTTTRSGSSSLNWFTETGVESGNPLNSLQVKNSHIDMSTAGTASIIYDNTHGTEIGWTPKVVFYNNVITTAGLWFDLRSFVSKFELNKNTFSSSYTGNTPFNLGYEVDGSDPQEINNYPFSQIVIKGNTFNYTASSHNHLFRPGVGAENGILRNNTFNATASGGTWGIILKASGWKVDHNNYYGPGPGIYVTTPNNYITNNTFHIFSSNPSILINSCQDSVYGGTTCIPYYNFIEDNIFYSAAAYPAIQHCDTSGCVSGSATQGTGRTEEYWSNVIDNNIYWRTDLSYVYQIGAATNIASYLTSDPISSVRSTWQSTTYTNAVSLSNYNDLSSNSIISNPGIDGSILDWVSSIKGTGSVSGSNIGAYSVTGGAGSSKMGLSI